LVMSEKQSTFCHVTDLYSLQFSLQVYRRVFLLDFQGILRVKILQRVSVHTLEGS